MSSLPITLSNQVKRVARDSSGNYILFNDLASYNVSFILGSGNHQQAHSELPPRKCQLACSGEGTTTAVRHGVPGFSRNLFPN